MNQSPANILVVDDDDISCKVLQSMLKFRGYTSKSATNGQECLAAMQQTHFNILLLDWLMPVMGGAETVALIRSGAAGEKYIDIPIIVITADLISSPREKCLQAGASRCLYKPINFRELTAVLAEELVAPSPGRSTSHENRRFELWQNTSINH